MWLASVSHRIDDKVHPAEAYTDAERRRAFHLLKSTMAGVGDKRWGRHFRMCITQCLHRGLSDAEIERLPQAWKDSPALDIAGGPIEVFWSKGIPDGLRSCDPCENIKFQPIPDPDGMLAKDWIGNLLKVPVDCGTCEPCIQRETAGPRYGACDVGSATQ